MRDKDLLRILLYLVSGGKERKEPGTLEDLMAGSLKSYKLS